MRRIALVLLVAACSDDAPATTPGDARPPCMDPTHDEDGDGIGDRCDVCPVVPDPLQRDTTELATMIRFADGVGDACDPRPALSGDKLATLHTFADPAAAAEWEGTGYVIDGDRATGTGTVRWMHRKNANGDGIYAQARLTWDESGMFEIVLDGNGVESGLVCSMLGNELRASEVGVAQTMKDTQPIGGVVVFSAWRLIDAQRRGQLRCRVAFDGGMAEVTIATSDDIAIGTYGIAQESTTTRIDSLVVYTSPAPKPN